MTGVLPGSQLVHHTLDLGSCQERQRHITTAGLTTNVCSCSHGVFPWEQQPSVDGEASEHTVVSNSLNVGAACLNQAVETLCSDERHLARIVHLGGGTLKTDTAKVRKRLIHWSN